MPARVFDIEMGTVRPDGSVKVEQRQVRLQKYERIGVTEVKSTMELFGVANLQKEPVAGCLPLVSQAILNEIEADTDARDQALYDSAVSSIGTPALSVALSNMQVAPTRTYKPKVIVDVLPLPKMPPRIVMWYRVAKDHLPCEVCGGDTLVRCYTDHLFHTPENTRPCHIRCGNGYAIREAREAPNRHERARRGIERPETPEWVTEMLK